ncbi:C-8 sterol isomerase [Carex rostrata]
MDDESAKNEALTPTASSKTPLSVSVSGAGPASTNSSYYLGCRKDANCHCEICLASINATRDLMSRTRLSSKDRSRPFIPLNRRTASPQTRSTVTAPMTPPLLRSTAKSRPFNGKKVEKRQRSRSVVGYRAIGFLALSLVLWIVDSGFLLKSFGPQLEREVIGRIGEESGFLLGDLKGRVGFVQEKLRPLVRDGARVRDCGAHKSDWELNQGGSQFFHWRCVIYESMAEEVSIWGSPLRTSGLLSTTFSSRHLTILSGKITEWSDGTPVPIQRGRNSSSWACRKWTYAAIQLNPETWVLEYRRNAFFEGPRLIPAICEMVMFKISEKVRRLKRRLFLGYHKVGQIVQPT